MRENTEIKDKLKEKGGLEYTIDSQLAYCINLLNDIPRSRMDFCRAVFTLEVAWEPYMSKVTKTSIKKLRKNGERLQLFPLYLSIFKELHKDMKDKGFGLTELTHVII